MSINMWQLGLFITRVQYKNTVECWVERSESNLRMWGEAKTVCHRVLRPSGEPSRGFRCRHTAGTDWRAVYLFQ